jgi:hypothetical protein
MLNRKIFRRIWEGGFSLVEVNMAVFVMAIGILSMVALYPLGLRESSQGTADLKQASFADNLLNQAVAAASDTNVTWSEWNAVPTIYDPDAGAGDRRYMLVNGNLPNFVKKYITLPTGYSWDSSRFVLGCGRIRNGLNSTRIMGFAVQSTDQQNLTSYNEYSNNTIYYAEATFQGKAE